MSALAAGELLAQSGERLVGGQGAGRLLRRARRARRRARRRGGGGGRRGGHAAGRNRVERGLGVGLAGRLHLLGVGLPTLAGVGVLLLPRLALLVEAVEPLTRLGVEALRVDVVALVVVRRRHAVEGRVEVLLALDEVLVGLLERQRDPATLEVDVDDLDHDVGAHLDDLLGQLDVPLGQLGDVHQALDAVVHADEGAERHQLGDLARHDLVDRVGPGELAPRVLLGRLQRQRDALAVQVDVEHLDLDLLADLDDLGRVVDVLPGELGDVHEAVHATQVHEGTEVDDGGHDALADLALLQLVEELGANLGLRLLEPGAAGQDHVVAVLVQLDDLRLELAADVGLQVTDATHLDQRGRKEAAEADVQDETTLDNLDDRTADDAVVFLDLLDGAPSALVLRALLREDQTAFLVLLGEDEGFNVVTDRHHFRGVHVMLDRQLARGDDTLGLVADVEQDLVPVDLDDGAFDDVAVVEVLDGLVDGGEESFLRPEIVDGGPGGARGGLDAARHVDCCSERMDSWCLTRPAELPTGTTRTNERH